MSFTLEWTIEGEKQLSRRLREISSVGKDLRRPFQRSADKLRSTFSKEVFSSKGRAIGVKWRPLSPHTVAQKARLGYSTEPLVRTGAMRRGFRARVTSTSAVIYNVEEEYFKYHQSNRPRSKIPRRVMMKLGINQKDQIIKIFHEELRKKVRKNV